MTQGQMNGPCAEVYTYAEMWETGLGWGAMKSLN